MTLPSNPAGSTHPLDDAAASDSTRATRFYGLIPCAGVGARAGTSQPKQYEPLAGVPMLRYALAAFSQSPSVARTVLVLAPGDQSLHRRFDEALFAGLRFEVAYCGGLTRHASVRNGLDALVAQGARADDWVLVHDAARPGLQAGMIENLIQHADGDGALLALPVADTLKRADDMGCSAGTVLRDSLWQAQTPQMFRIGRLMDALDHAEASGAIVTDEASAIERLGDRPTLVRGSLRNFKVTYPEDFALAECFLAGNSHSSRQEP
ncbi:MAG TPA: 2-C-methyl-D-erythritol 4-phosphate cytidylyltransferase [Burkholderiaceae bacterium]|nr:2-C-methyl-D-erythritol 4-phosphate cytidylyltransferase [Burkholderiaceae bacterium]